MEQEGIYYWFRHERNRHILVLSDAYGAHQSPPNYASVPYYPPTLEQRERDHFYDWHMAREVQSGSLSLNDYDFQRPGARLEVRSNIARSHAAADYPLYDYPGEYVQSQDGEQYARTRIEALQARYERVRLRGRARGLGSGHLFKLSGYPREDQNREYLVVGADYRVVQELYETGGGGVGAQFESELDCIDAGQAYRPLPTTPLPIVRGPQTAVVVGPKGEEIWTDQYGRVKVHFHWDRHDQSNENSSCWIRVSQAWAGKNWGSVQIPRIGQEVIVSFLEGDPDRPIITGRVYNAEQTVPYELPANASVRRQLVGHRLLGVVDPPGDDRPVRVSFEEADDHFLADPRDLDRAPVLPGPGLRDAHPAGAVLVGLVVAVPVEMHLDPAILVGPDLLALGPDHHRGLRATHHRHRGRRQGAESLAGVDTVQLALELRAAPAITGLVEFLDYPVLGANHQVFAVLVQARVVAQVEQMARPDTPGASPQANSLVLGLDRLDAGPCIVFAVLTLHILARVVVERVVGRGMGAPDIGAHFQAGAGTLEVVVVEAQRAGLDLTRHVPVEEVVALAMAEARRVVGHAGVAGRAVVRAVGIGEHQDVALLLVAEPVVDAFLFHQPADEIEAGLAVSGHPAFSHLATDGAYAAYASQARAGHYGQH